MSILVVDIGSTWMKAGLLTEPRHSTSHQPLELISQWRTATSRTNLTQGFYQVLAQAELQGFSWQNAPEKLVVSSSAKGGLSIVALGIVPDLTLKAAKMAAFSAGGKVVDHFAYELTLEDVEKINQLNPDIILFAGGTDGGNTRIVDHNAQALQDLTISPTILFAGNRTAWTKVATRLSHFPLVKADNLLPELSRTEPDSARLAIRRIFLERILSGKGLDQIQQLTRYPILPTPQVVFDYLHGIHSFSRTETGTGNSTGLGASTEQDFCLIDLGGATTDVYSVVKEIGTPQGVILKGIVEQKLTRTVEGDLGMRISAPGVLELLLDLEQSAHGSVPYITKLCASIPDWDIPRNQHKIVEYIKDLPRNTDWIAQEPWQIETDKVLAQLAIVTSLVRHAGSYRQCYTPQGTVWLQEGKDLRSCNKLILTGGTTAFFNNPLALASLESDFSNLDYSPFIPRHQRDSRSQESLVLLPPSWTIVPDHEYLLPLLANGSRLYPEAARTSFITRFLEAQSWN